MGNGLISLSLMNDDTRESLSLINRSDVNSTSAPHPIKLKT